MAQRPLSGDLPSCRPPGRTAALAWIDNHPLLEVVRRQGAIAERAIEVARAERRPNWGWSAMYGQRAGNRADVVSLMVSFDLPLNRSRLQNQRILEARELAAAARDVLEDTRRELIAQLEQALAEQEAAEARLDATNTITLPALRAAERALEARYAAGGGDLASVLAARERTTRTELQLAEQAGAAGRASANLLFYIEECGA
ncbi:MAG: TolC family protein [Pseudomonadota bacterium]|nr:TolC family protein [Pseudomonadota bacterium]